MKIAGKIIQLINEYGKQIVSEALTIIDMVGEFDGAWAMTEDMGMLGMHDVINEDVHTVIDELMNFDMEEYYS